MRRSTSFIVRDNGDPQPDSNYGQNEVDLDGMESFMWVWCMKRISSGTPASIISLRPQFTSTQEGTGGGRITVNFDDPDNADDPSFVTASVDGDALTAPNPAADIPNVGDIALRVVYGDTRELSKSDQNPRYINTTNRVGGSKLIRCAAAILFPKDYIQNMKYIGRARTDTGLVSNDDDSPYTQIDERLFPEVCVLQADGTYYDSSAL